MPEYRFAWSLVSEIKIKCSNIRKWIKILYALSLLWDFYHKRDGHVSQFPSRSESGYQRNTTGDI